MNATDDARLPIRSLVLGPALITLALTLLRLTGELLGWAPSVFVREGGGGGSLLGIVWLAPVFGAFYGLRLAGRADRPAGLDCCCARACPWQRSWAAWCSWRACCTSASWGASRSS